MKLLKPEPQLAQRHLRALTAIARAADAGLARPQRALLEALEWGVFETGSSIDSLEPIEADELGARIGDSAQARQLIRLMIVVSLADGPPNAKQMTQIRAFEEALAVREPAVGVVGHLARGKLLRFRLAFMRHSHLRNYLRNSYRMLGGVLPVLAAILRFRGVIREDSLTAARYREFEKLPNGSLGQAFFLHCTKAGLPFPGERGGFPAGAIYHDFTHVLAGYDTSPEGEMKAAAFQAGFTKTENDFFTVLFAIVIHTAGINLAPFPMPVLRGRIGQGDLAKDFVRALQRGGSTTVDLGDGWDFWQFVERPIDLVREELGIPPIAEAMCP